MAFLHFMRNPALSSLSAPLSSRKSNSSGLRDMWLSSYAAVIKFLLTMYAIYDVTARVVKFLKTFKQGLGVSPTELAKRVYTKALRCGMLYEGKRVNSLFVERLQDAVCNDFRLYWSRNPSNPLTQLVRYDATVTKIADHRSTASGSSSRPN